MDTEERNITIGIMMVFIGFFAVVVFFTNLGSKVSCLQAYAEYQPQYSFFAGCRVMWDGKLTPTDIVRQINIK